MLPLLGKIAKTAITVIGKKAVGKIGGRTIVGKILTGVGVAGVGMEAGRALTTTAQPQLPALPGAGGGVLMPSQFPGVGAVPWWRGPGGKLQFPWQDPRVPEFLKAFALDDAYLRAYYRAPRGYVIVRDPNGRPYAVLKMAARRFGLWRQPHKPPISAGDWNKYQTARRVEKKLVKIARSAIRKHGSSRARFITAKRSRAACSARAAA